MLSIACFTFHPASIFSRPLTPSYIYGVSTVLGLCMSLAMILLC
jgi:hypothetical protein